MMSLPHFEVTFLVKTPIFLSLHCMSPPAQMPVFTSASNMSVVYTFTGGTAHIDCGVDMRGEVLSYVKL